jgi:transposase
MALGRRKDETQELWVASTDLARAPGHPFYTALNELLAEGGFDRWVEKLCRPYYADSGRPGIPPGVYFRMIFVGYFEGLGSQRGIAWRCADSLSLRDFLGIAVTDRTPDHSSLTIIRKRLPLDVFHQVFSFVLKLAHKKGFFKGKIAGMDATLLEANAAMRSIVRRDTGEDWKEYVRRLAEEEGVEIDDDEDLRRYDKRRKKKSASNKDWVSKTDPDSRVMRMKDKRTHLSYKAEHVADLETDLILAAEIYEGTRSDGSTAAESARKAKESVRQTLGRDGLKDMVADKGYDKAEALADLQGLGLRTYVPERDDPYCRIWTDKPAAWKKAVYANRRRVRGKRNGKLQRRRTEVAERSFAHACGTGDGRRAWLRGLEEVRKRHLVLIAALNLGVIMRKAFGIGTPRSLQDLSLLLLPLFRATQALLRPSGWPTRILGVQRVAATVSRRLAARDPVASNFSLIPASSTGC